MDEGYAYTTVKKIHILLGEYFKYLFQEEHIYRNPMVSVPMIKKSNFMAAHQKEYLPKNKTVTVFTPEEIEKFKAEAFRCWGTGKRIYQQSAAYILMLNTGLRTGEVLGLINSDIDLDNKVIHLQKGVKEIVKRDGLEAESGREVKIGKLKSAISKRDVPLNATAIEMIQELRKEFYFGKDTPSSATKTVTTPNPSTSEKDITELLAAAEIEKKGLHSLRHPYVKPTTKINL